VPRVIGIDPGTVSIDVCGLDDGRVFLDETFPTADALARPAALVALLERAGALDLVAGPSGYGLPLVRAADATEAELRLAFLAAAGEAGGIGGLRTLTQALGATGLPVVLTPGVVHLPSVPAHRKVNRVDMGTADKVCAVALAIREQAEREGCAERDVALVLVELGGAFTAAVAVEGGRIVDGAGGSSGPMGVRASGALDGEVAFLAGAVTKELVFRGGAAAVAGRPDATPEELAADGSPRGATAWEAYLEGAVKAVAALMVAAPEARAVVLSGRVATVPGVCEALAERLGRVAAAAPVRRLAGFARVAKHAAQGAALIADGLAGGASSALVAAMGIRDAAGTVLDHLHVVAPADARRRLGLA
jgi:predicted butyrate kinase (DUF1464 family)